VPFALGYGRTPVSKGDETRLASPCNIFGTITGDVKTTGEDQANDRVTVTVI